MCDVISINPSASYSWIIKVTTTHKPEILSISFESSVKRESFFSTTTSTATTKQQRRSCVITEERAVVDGLMKLILNVVFVVVVATFNDVDDVIVDFNIFFNVDLVLSLISSVGCCRCGFL
jgi:hypothetical protein